MSLEQQIAGKRTPDHIMARDYDLPLSYTANHSFSSRTNGESPVKRHLAIPLCLGVLMLCPTLASAQASKAAGERAEALRVVDVWLDAEQAYQHIPAVSAGVVVGDDLVWSKGYGTIDAERKVAASPKTIYSICSISKLFTSVALMEQYDAGKVRLDDPITTYLPWAKLK